MTNGKILVVDDEIRICELMEVYFCKGGYDVRSVCTGAEAIELIKNEEFDLVLCDYAMPKISGYDVATVLNELGKKPKIGIMTGWEEKLKLPEDEGLKVDFIIKKPFDLSELTKLINDTLYCLTSKKYYPPKLSSEVLETVGQLAKEYLPVS